MLLIVSLFACSEYNIVPEKAETPAEPSDVTDVPADVPETNEEDVDTEPTDTDTATTEEPSEDEDLDDDGCWFAAWEYYNDYDIGVKTLPVYRLVSPAEVTVAPGDDVVLQFAVSSYNECGDIDLNALFFGVYDRAEESYEWMKDVNDDSIDGYFEDVSGESEFNPYAASNMYVTPTGDQLHYIWQDGSGMYTDYYPVNMATERVEAHEEKVYEFIWTASDYAPSGTTMTVMFTEVWWTDVTTNQKIGSTRQGLEGIEVTVHIE